MIKFLRPFEQNTALRQHEKNTTPPQIVARSAVPGLPYLGLLSRSVGRLAAFGAAMNLADFGCSIRLYSEGIYAPAFPYSTPSHNAISIALCYNRYCKTGRYKFGVFAVGSANSPPNHTFKPVRIQCLKE